MSEPVLNRRVRFLDDRAREPTDFVVRFESVSDKKDG